MAKFNLGYTAGVFDMFHIGHLNILRSAKGLCRQLMVGVSTDELVKRQKKNKPIIPFKERIAIVREIRLVDVAIPQHDFDKYEAWKKLKYNVLFVGDDWFDDKKWKEYESKLSKVGVPVIYFPYTRNISSTILRKKI